MPEGLGRTGRLRTLVGALVGLGHKVVIWNEHNLDSAPGQAVTGELAGAPFEYVLGTTQRGGGFKAIGPKLRSVKVILQKVRQSARAGQLDLVIFNNLAFYDTFPITRLANRLGIPTIQCYEDERKELIVGGLGLATRLFGWNAWAADRWCSPMADQIWVISSYLEEKYARLSGNADRVVIIPTIIDCNEWTFPPEPAHPKPVLLYSGSFAEQEDIEKLARALGVLRRQGIKFQMRFLGARPDLPRVQQLQALAGELGIANCIELKGVCPSSVVKEEVCNANILLNLRNDSLWSRSGLSTKLSEYLASGRTVLTTDVGDNARYVQHGQSALVVGANDPPEKVADVLRQAIESPELRRRLGAGARQAALTHFDVPVVQRKMAAALSGITGG